MDHEQMPEYVATLYLIISQLEFLCQLANNTLWEIEQACVDTFPDLTNQPPINDTLQ